MSRCRRPPTTLLDNANYRTMYTKIINKLFATYSINYRVPRVFVTSMLFSLFVNNLPYASNFDTAHFADTYLHLSHSDIQVLQAKANVFKKISIESVW